jgi:tetratricopeptide (TPR) repeat protein
MLYRRLWVCALLSSLALLVSGVAFGDEGNQFSFSVSPTYLMPLRGATNYFTPGGAAALSVEYRLPVVDFLGLRLDLDGSYLPIWTGDGTAFFAVGGGPGLYLPPLGGFTGSLFGSAGYYYGIIADPQNRGGGNFYLAGGLRLGWNITPTFNTGIEVSYRYVANGPAALYQGLGVGVSARFNLLQASPIRIQDVHLNDLFPVLLKHYDTHSVGSVTFDNSGKAPIKDLEVSFFVDKYMDNATSCPAPSTLNGGQKVTLDLYALFSEKVLSITEATVLSGKVSIAYTQENKRHTVEKSATLHMQDRNAMTWDDTKKIAAFVLYKDPAVLEIAKSLARVVKDTTPSIDTNLSTAMALHEALRLYGISYVVDPTSSYVVQSKSKVAVDYIQYPRNTLQYKSGDCDDLSVLYTALLQGVGIDTAFITIPGHIYMAFALKSTPDQARRLLSDPSSIIVQGDRAWVPVEITITSRDFLEAWATGLSEWKDNEKDAEFIPTTEAWQTYEPVGYFDDTRPISFVADADMKASLVKELGLLADRELTSHKARIEKAQGAGGSNTASLNQLAVLSVQYGRDDEAKSYLTQALKAGENYAALMNLANILYLEEDYRGAVTYYLRAQKVKPMEAAVSLGLTRVYGKLGDTAATAQSYKTLATLDPALASRNSSLDPSQAGGARGAEAQSERETMQWQE